MRRLLPALALLLLAPLFARADDFQTLTFTVDGVTRIALIHVPADETRPAPLVFVFHGHGGSARQIARNYGLDRLWPDAIAVYMQGLPTVGQLTDPEGKLDGWQGKLGEQGDRDLKFFDAVLARVKKEHAVDPRRIYCTGHSNGGAFTYLLWLARGDVFAAVAPSAAVAGYAHQLSPKPALLIGGDADPLVKSAWQQRMMAAVRRADGCPPEGKPWEDTPCTLYPSAGGTPVVTFVYAGGHTFNPAAPALIVRFFREHPRP